MRTLPVLVYHKVSAVPAGTHHPRNHVRPAQFAAQLRLLRAAGFRSVTFRDYLDYRCGRAALRRRPILITFDDGYRSNFDVAVPLLLRYGFTATVFVVSGCVGGTNCWDADEPQEPLLGEGDIHAMQALGIDFQSHTASHKRLTRLAPGEALRELRDSRRTLEEILGTRVTVISYPWSDYDASVVRLAEEAGYEAGVIVRRRTNFDHTPLFALRRIGIHCDTSLRRFAWDLARLRWRGD